MLALLLACTSAEPSLDTNPVDAETSSPDVTADADVAIDPNDCRTSCSLGDATDDVHLTKECGPAAPGAAPQADPGRPCGCRADGRWGRRRQSRTSAQ